MKLLVKGGMLSLVGLSVLLIGCAGDANEPKTLQQQQAMARGHAPTKEQLDAAMSHFKAPPQAPQHP